MVRSYIAGLLREWSGLPGGRGLKLWLLSLLMWALPAMGATIVDPGHGAETLAPGTPMAAGLSGLAYAGADVYYAIGDGSGVTAFELDIEIDLTTAEILSATVVDSQVLAAGGDLEGIVHHPLGGSVLVSDEVGYAIREHSLSDGSVLSTLGVPAIFANVRSNFGLESLAMRVAPSSADDALWTANEEALTVDGALSTNTTGSIVRLQRFDDLQAADGQWAYVTDPYPGGAAGGLERSGVSEMLSLPNGEVLVLERSFSSQLFRARIYQVDFAGATDTSALTDLAVDPFTPVSKTLLWQTAFILQNYEGLAIGPQLDAGDWSLLLISDSGGGAPQNLYALRLQPMPEPSAALQLGAGLLALWLVHARRHGVGAVSRRRRSSR